MEVPWYFTTRKPTRKEINTYLQRTYLKVVATPGFFVFDCVLFLLYSKTPWNIDLEYQGEDLEAIPQSFFNANPELFRDSDTNTKFFYNFSHTGHRNKDRKTPEGLLHSLFPVNYGAFSHYAMVNEEWPDYTFEDPSPLRIFVGSDTFPTILRDMNSSGFELVRLSVPIISFGKQTDEIGKDIHRTTPNLKESVTQSSLQADLDAEFYDEKDNLLQNDQYSGWYRIPRNIFIVILCKWISSMLIILNFMDWGVTKMDNVYKSLIQSVFSSWCAEKGYGSRSYDLNMLQVGKLNYNRLRSKNTIIPQTKKQEYYTSLPALDIYYDETIRRGPNFIKAQQMLGVPYISMLMYIKQLNRLERTFQVSVTRFLLLGAAIYFCYTISDSLLPDPMTLNFQKLKVGISDFVAMCVLMVSLAFYHRKNIVSNLLRIGSLNSIEGEIYVNLDNLVSALTGALFTTSIKTCGILFFTVWVTNTVASYFKDGSRASAVQPPHKVLLVAISTIVFAFIAIYRSGFALFVTLGAHIVLQLVV